MIISIRYFEIKIVIFAILYIRNRIAMSSDQTLVNPLYNYELDTFSFEFSLNKKSWSTFLKTFEINKSY